MAEPVRTVEDIDVSASQPAGGLGDDVGQLVDEHSVECDSAVGCGGRSLDAHFFRVGLGQDADPVGVGFSGFDDFGDELLSAQLSLALGQLGLSCDHLTLRLGLGEWADLRGFRLGLVNLGFVLGLHDGSLSGVFGLLRSDSCCAAAAAWSACACAILA